MLKSLSLHARFCTFCLLLKFLIRSLILYNRDAMILRPLTCKDEQKPLPRELVSKQWLANELFLNGGLLRACRSRGHFACLSENCKTIFVTVLLWLKGCTVLNVLISSMCGWCWFIYTALDSIWSWLDVTPTTQIWENNQAQSAPIWQLCMTSPNLDDEDF